MTNTPSDSEPLAGRRSYDRDLDPMIENFVERRLTEVRHGLRTEFSVALNALTIQVTEVSKAVAAGNLQSTKEHVENQAAIDAISRDLATVLPLIGRVTDLEHHDDLDVARESTKTAVLSKLDKNRKAMLTMGIALAGVIVAAAALILTHGH